MAFIGVKLKLWS